MNSWWRPAGCIEGEQNVEACYKENGWGRRLGVCCMPFANEISEIGHSTRRYRDAYNELSSSPLS